MCIMSLKHSLSLLFASFALLGLAHHTQAQQDAALIRMGNGIAAIAEGEIITIEQLRRELEPIIPRRCPLRKRILREHRPHEP
mgnify:CR=1 FL=1